MSNKGFRVELRQALTGLALCLAVTLVASCGGNKKGEESPQVDVEAMQTPPLPDFADADSTVYGRADGFGGGGFTLIANDGRELELTLTGEGEADDNSPSYAHVYGDREDTARYAVTVKNGEAVDVLINLSQLERQLGTSYVIHNGLLFVPNDAGEWEQVTILQLDDKVLRAQTAKGDIRSFRGSKK